MQGTLAVTGDADADRLLNTDPLALLIGMLLDQQVPMEWAFKGPALLKERLGGELDADKIAAMDSEELVAVFCQKPALHRFPASMARRAHEMCVAIAKDYDGDAAAIWEGARTGDELFARLARAAWLRRGEVEDLRRHPGKAHGSAAGGLGAGRRSLRRSRAPVGSRHRQRRGAREGQAVEEGEEGRRQNQAGLTIVTPRPGGDPPGDRAPARRRRWSEWARTTRAGRHRPPRTPRPHAQLPRACTATR